MDIWMWLILLFILASLYAVQAMKAGRSQREKSEADRLGLTVAQLRRSRELNLSEADIVLAVSMGRDTAWMSVDDALEKVAADRGAVRLYVDE